MNMKYLWLAATLMVADTWCDFTQNTTFKQHEPEHLIKTHSTQDLTALLEKISKQLDEQNTLNRILVSLMLRNAQNEEHIIQAAQAEQKKAYELQKRQDAEREARPLPQKIIEGIAEFAVRYSINYLWPMIRHRITVSISDHIIAIGCEYTDAASAQYLGRYTDTRLSDWILRTSDERVQKQNERWAFRQDPKLATRVAELHKLQKDSLPAVLADMTKREIERLQPFNEENIR